MKAGKRPRAGRSALAQEKFADHLMGVATGVSISLISGLLVLPLLGIAKLVFFPDKPFTLKGMLMAVSTHPFQCFLFIVLYLLALGFIEMVRQVAAKYYDEVDRISKDRRGDRTWSR
ncbi:hypothetical protein NYQ43_13690 [Xanthomonas translucens pv. translucens]|uniref:hypothetical protein n=1 Tax=Xanthomonas campestris pv. translucens TaxID=343 RepID=UPI0007E34979|nr:hypothetical protein [Xanthomonas translucens]MCT8286720.1 hypothetical protein [Xanthomonas translucens pv. translucens]MCT8304378.1 hypothetical protein [Xanthomonas translucens pv. translucens]OAX55609.1 hypothetical protein A6R79_02515 [Xanthomonas translucens pv. translucens]QSQ31491.1 hypothetical protein ISN30_06590 [Xanthomonas translucens pv. translucens]QSQ37010.1 hypothetical protein ISN32_14480 [Xanthomonas translucens pv. translucens]